MGQGRLAGKCALISGGASGMGAAEAEKFVAEGAKVVIGDLNEELGRNHAKKLGDAAVFTPLDVRSQENWDSAIETCEEHFRGPIDILVNNAGVLRRGALEETSLEGIPVYYRRYANWRVPRNAGGCAFNAESRRWRHYQHFFDARVLSRFRVTLRMSPQNGRSAA